jgi:hypothetical protein
LLTTAPAPDHLKDVFDTIWSGWHFRDDDHARHAARRFRQPVDGLVDRGLDSWNAAQGKGGESCAGCHQGPESMQGLRAVTPRVDAKTGKLMIVEDYINTCVTERMGLEAWGVTGNKMKDMLSRHLAAVARHGAERCHRRPGGAVLGTGQGNLLHPLRATGDVLRQLPRGQLRQQHPRRTI